MTGDTEHSYWKCGTTVRAEACAILTHFPSWSFRINGGTVSPTESCKRINTGTSFFWSSSRRETQSFLEEEHEVKFDQEVPDLIDENNERIDLPPGSLVSRKVCAGDRSVRACGEALHLPSTVLGQVVAMLLKALVKPNL
jgi:hypothetical protein